MKTRFLNACPKCGAMVCEHLLNADLQTVTPVKKPVKKIKAKPVDITKKFYTQPKSD